MSKKTIPQRLKPRLHSSVEGRAEARPLQKTVTQILHFVQDDIKNIGKGNCKDKQQVPSAGSGQALHFVQDDIKDKDKSKGEGQKQEREPRQKQRQRQMQILRLRLPLTRQTPLRMTSRTKATAKTKAGPSSLVLDS